MSNKLHLNQIRKLFEQAPSCTLRVKATHRREDGSVSKVDETVKISDVSYIQYKVDNGGYEIKEIIKL